jgi:hypothetical protein
LYDSVRTRIDDGDHLNAAVRSPRGIVSLSKDICIWLSSRRRDAEKLKEEYERPHHEPPPIPDCFGSVHVPCWLRDTSKKGAVRIWRDFVAPRAK